MARCKQQEEVVKRAAPQVPTAFMVRLQGKREAQQAKSAASARKQPLTGLPQSKLLTLEAMLGGLHGSWCKKAAGRGELSARAGSQPAAATASGRVGQSA